MIYLFIVNLLEKVGETEWGSGLFFTPMVAEVVVVVIRYRIMSLLFLITSSDMHKCIEDLGYLYLLRCA
ncbi:hypothetical protein Hanom_Chr16g01477311 [Helianthus anomalus]